MNGPAPARPVRSGRTLAFGLVALLISAVVTFALAEAAIRFVARPGAPLEERLRPYDPFAIQVEPHGIAGYRPKPNAVFRYRNGTAAHVNAQRFRGPEVPLTKSVGTQRIVLVGGSTTFGWGVNDDASIDAHLRVLLDSMMPGRSTEVINAALDGYDSWQILERVRGEVLALDPDLLIVNAGINDLRSARYRDLVDADPRTRYWDAPMTTMRREAERGRPFLRTRLKHASYVVRLGLFLRDVVYEVGQATPRRGASRRLPVYWDAADYFERNVRRVADLGLERGFAVIFSTPPSALRMNFAPDDTAGIIYWLNDAEETQVYRDTLAARLAGVSEEYARRGLPTSYVRPEVPGNEFLDDTHLTADGNRRVADALARAALPLLTALDR